MNRNQPKVPPAEAGSIIYGAEPLFGSGFALFLPALLTPLAGPTYANEELTPPLLSAACWSRWPTWCSSYEARKAAEAGPQVRFL